MLVAWIEFQATPSTGCVPTICSLAIRITIRARALVTANGRGTRGRQLTSAGSRKTADVRMQTPGFASRPQSLPQTAHPEGVEPPTYGSEVRCSIQLSYGCVPRCSIVPPAGAVK